MRLQAITSSGSFTVEGLSLGRGWSTVDLDDDAVRAAMLAYAGTHLRMHPDDLEQLAVHGLAFDHGRVVVVEVVAGDDEEATTEADEPGEPGAEEAPSGGRRRRKRA